MGKRPIAITRGALSGPTPSVAAISNFSAALGAARIAMVSTWSVL